MKAVSVDGRMRIGFASAQFVIKTAAVTLQVCGDNKSWLCRWTTDDAGGEQWLQFVDNIVTLRCDKGSVKCEPVAWNSVRVMSY